MNNGIIFGDQGPIMQGTWYNPHTGDSFTVRDSFFDNGQFMVSTTDGRVLGYELVQNYIQSDKPENFDKFNSQQQSIPQEVLSEIEEPQNTIELLPEDAMLLNNPRSLGNLNQPTSTPLITTNDGIIEKALSKATKPQVVADVNWVDFPKKHIEMLNEIMGIDTKEIVEWYARQLDTTEIAIAIHNSLVRYINDQLYGKVDETSEAITSDVSPNTYTHTSITIEDTPETSIKKTTKKTTKKSTKK